MELWASLQMFTFVYNRNVEIAEIEKGLFLGLVVVEKAQARI